MLLHQMDMQWMQKELGFNNFLKPALCRFLFFPETFILIMKMKKGEKHENIQA